MFPVPTDTSTETEETNSIGPDEEISVEKNILYNAETLKYMRIIDMYKKLGIGKDIELPRIVIAGARSCGKSSLLENLTGLPVPITSGIGTRFPVEINFIEDLKDFRITPCIVLDPSRKLSKRKRQKIGLESFDTSSNQISSHVLQIEMRGPNFENLSFVDTPGLYQSANSARDATSMVDIDNLVASLIREKRTVVAAVTKATQSTASQKIFKLADDVDPTGETTIGVLTRCDLVVNADTESFGATFGRARNEERILAHGWYAVKNRSSAEAEANVSLDAARNREAKLFIRRNWHSSISGVPEERMGISALRRLSNIFCAHIRAEFSVFNQQTRNILKQRQSQLAALGIPRSTLLEQRDYLRSIVEAHQLLLSKCLKEDFNSSSDIVVAASPLRRRLAYVKRMLRDDLRNNGAEWPFETATPEKDSQSDDEASRVDFEEIDTASIYTWINDRYQRTKSCTMPGLVPYPLIERLFKEQTGDWMTITQTFVLSVKDQFISTIDYCLEKACSSHSIYTALKDIVFAALGTKLEEFEKCCFSLLENEWNSLQAIACEDQFVSDVQEARTLRFISALASLESTSSPQKPLVRRGAQTGGQSMSSSASLSFGGSGKSLFGPPSASSKELSAPGAIFGSRTEPIQTNFKTLAGFAKNNKDKLKEVLTHDRQIVYQIHDILKHTTPHLHSTTLIQYARTCSTKILSSR